MSSTLPADLNKSLPIRKLKRSSSEEVRGLSTKKKICFNKEDLLIAIIKRSFAMGVINEENFRGAEEIITEQASQLSLHGRLLISHNNRVEELEKTVESLKESVLLLINEGKERAEERKENDAWKSMFV
ncbi:hypothetical protein AB751O23_AA_00320 [Chlamydiales bacterium SCGC AB-751-O23]|jgi:hypothetical protein|nr:hypothetical protein AB751O23_AA_00320 [Chlamydiales bacterium SCGC AB-751-O23]